MARCPCAGCHQLHGLWKNDLVPFAGRHAPADAARVAALAARVALLERELQDSERTHALRCALEQLPQRSCARQAWDCACTAGL